jgi:hypothetical protein
MDNERRTKKAIRDIGKAINKGQISALNKAAKSAFSGASKFIRESYNIKKEDLDKLANIRKATTNNPVAQLVIHNKVVSLYKFKGSQTSKGAKASTRKGKAKVYRGSFIAVMANKTEATAKKSKKVRLRKNVFREITGADHAGIFARRTSKRLPLKELYGPSGMQLFGSDANMEYFTKKFQERFDELLAHEIEYFVDRT